VYAISNQHKNIEKRRAKIKSVNDFRTCRNVAKQIYYNL
jgi:hypothetical protein